MTLKYCKEIQAPLPFWMNDELLVKNLWGEARALFEAALEAEAHLERREPEAALATLREVLGRVPEKHEVENYMRSVMAKETLL